MGFSCGIVGLPNVGKSTLFNALTSAGAAAANYPFCTIDPNVGIVAVPDGRLEAIARLVRPRKVTPTAMQFVDIAGLVKGASQGEGLGNQFLAHIRQVEAIAHVVRCFASTDVTHVEGSVDPVRDVAIINLELALADLETVTKRKNRVEKLLKTGEARYRAEWATLARLEEGLNAGRPARAIVDGDVLAALKAELPLLTGKPVLYVANVGEEQLGPDGAGPQLTALAGLAAGEGARLVVVSAQLEAEMAELGPEEKRDFLRDYGLEKSGLEQLVQAGYELLGLITFLTAGEPEARAWTIAGGTKAPQAAGKIHSDIERGFIRAEVVSFDEFVAAGGWGAAREQGRVRLEGKDYVMRDGDVVYFRFNV